MTTVTLGSLLNDFVSTGWDACLEAAPADSGTHVYAIIVTGDNSPFPLYVGQTGRLCGRIGDYTMAEFHAPTDFRVGEAIKYLRTQKMCRVDFFYRPSEAHLQDEKVLIREFLLAGYTLLNFLAAFDYKTANRDEERSLVHRFCDMALLRSKA
jgi:hypothetical protein